MIDCKKRVYAMLESNPGMSGREISRLTGLSRNRVTFHVNEYKQSAQQRNNALCRCTHTLGAHKYRCCSCVKFVPKQEPRGLVGLARRLDPSTITPRSVWSRIADTLPATIEKSSKHRPAP